MDEHKRRRGQIGEQIAIGAHGQQGIGAKAGVGQKANPIATEHPPLQSRGVWGVQAFAKLPPHQGAGEGAINHQHHQGRAPAAVCGEPAPQRGTQTQNKTQPGEGLGHQARALGGTETVAHDGTGAHHHRAHGRALQGAPQNQLLNGRRQGAKNRSQGESRQATQQHRTPAPAVGQRAPKQL